MEKPSIGQENARVAASRRRRMWVKQPEAVMEFYDKWALITGASMGLGRAFAMECAGAECGCFWSPCPAAAFPSWPRDSQGTTASKPMARRRPHRTRYPQAASKQNRRQGIGIDLLVNNAGIGTVGRFMDHTLEYHEATIELNTLALVRIIRFFLPELRSHKASILNVASLGAFFPMPTMSIYSATKSFVLRFSLALGKSWETRLGVSVLCPNAIRTTEEVNFYIDNLGFIARHACYTADCIARAGLDGVARNQAIIVPEL
jgi:short-subunit dehydrogenase